jgi:hypothetical protein
MKENKPEQFEWWEANKYLESKIFDRSWTYREMYERLGGEIETKTGRMSDLKPVRHSAKVKAAMA